MTMLALFLGYFFVGIVIAEIACPWIGFEKIVAAALWPITVVVGLFLLVKDLRKPPSTMMDLEYTLLLTMLLVKAEAIKIEEKAKEKREDWRMN